MSSDRTWPNANHYQLLQDGTLEQLENLYAFLPAVQTKDQNYYMRQLALRTRELQQIRFDAICKLAGSR